MRRSFLNCANLKELRMNGSILTIEDGESAIMFRCSETGMDVCELTNNQFISNSKEVFPVESYQVPQECFSQLWNAVMAEENEFKFITINLNYSRQSRNRG